MRQETKVVVSKDQLSANLGDTLAILHMGSNTYYGLDEVGLRVWELIQKPVSIGQLCENIVNEYDVDPKVLETDIVSLLEEMLEAGLVEIVNA